ncbi:hypothetical protein [Kibdelosporangium philippinense]
MPAGHPGSAATGGPPRTASVTRVADSLANTARTCQRLRVRR